MMAGMISLILEFLESLRLFKKKNLVELLKKLYLAVANGLYCMV